MVTSVELLAQDLQLDALVGTPLELCPQIRRLVVEALGARERANGGAPRSRSLTAWLLAMEIGSQRHLEALVRSDPADSSASGSGSAGPAMVPMSSNDAAKLLGVSREWACRLARTGVLRGSKVGGQWVVDQVALEQYRRQRA